MCLQQIYVCTLIDVLISPNNLSYVPLYVACLPLFLPSCVALCPLQAPLLAGFFKPCCPSLPLFLCLLCLFWVWGLILGILLAPFVLWFFCVLLCPFVAPFGCLFMPCFWPPFVLRFRHSLPRLVVYSENPLFAFCSPLLLTISGPLLCFLEPSSFCLLVFTFLMCCRFCPPPPFLPFHPFVLIFALALFLCCPCLFLFVSWPFWPFLLALVFPFIPFWASISFILPLSPLVCCFFAPFGPLFGSVLGVWVVVFYPTLPVCHFWGTFFWPLVLPFFFPCFASFARLSFVLWPLFALVLTIFVFVLVSLAQTQLPSFCLFWGLVGFVLPYSPPCFGSLLVHSCRVCVGPFNPSLAMLPFSFAFVGAFFWPLFRAIRPCYPCFAIF